MKFLVLLLLMSIGLVNCNTTDDTMDVAEKNYWTYNNNGAVFFFETINYTVMTSDTISYSRESVIKDTMILNQTCKKVTNYNEFSASSQYHKFDQGEHLVIDTLGNRAKVMKNDVSIGDNWTYTVFNIDFQGDSIYTDYTHECMDIYPTYSLKGNTYEDVVKMSVDLSQGGAATGYNLHVYYAKDVGFIQSKQYYNGALVFSRNLLNYQL